MKNKIEVLKEAIKCCNAKTGIKAIVNLVNQAWDKNVLGKYYRYSSLLQDLEHMLALELETRYNSFFAGNCYTARRAIIEAAHAEALQINNRISTETHQYVQQLNLALDEVQVQGMNVVLVCRGHKEPLFALFHCDDGSFSWFKNVCLPPNVKEELPAFYVDEEALRIMLDYVAKELHYELANL
ncbi:hypothetical protein ACSTWI_000814 [Escherichia coli]|nr:hypothetical protein [Escherichia coli]